MHTFFFTKLLTSVDNLFKPMFFLLYFLYFSTKYFPLFLSQVRKAHYNDDKTFLNLHFCVRIYTYLSVLQIRLQALLFLSLIKNTLFAKPFCIRLYMSVLQKYAPSTEKKNFVTVPTRLSENFSRTHRNRKPLI